MFKTDPKLMLDKFWDSLNIPKSDFYSQVQKMSIGCYYKYTLVLKSMLPSHISPVFYEKAFELFLSALFFDYTLDSSITSQENKITALFLGNSIFANYHTWLSENFDDKYLALFQKYLNSQMYYQFLEHDWNNPDNYATTLCKYDENYYLKSIILLFPLELLVEYEVSVKYINDLSNLFQKYMSAILLIDDFKDIELDIKDQILTPLISMYYNEYCELPNDKADFPKAILNRTLDELEKIIHKLIDKSKSTNINIDIMLDRIMNIRVSN